MQLHQVSMEDSGMLNAELVSRLMQYPPEAEVWMEGNAEISEVEKVRELDAGNDQDAPFLVLEYARRSLSSR